MTREEARKAAEVMLAYAEGKEVGYYDHNKVWQPLESPAFDWNNATDNYSIKPSLKYHPFKDAKECWNEMLNHQPFGWVKYDGDYLNITSVSDYDVMGYLGGDDPVIISFKYLELNKRPKVTFADGTPFGIKEEE